MQSEAVSGTDRWLPPEVKYNTRNGLTTIIIGFIIILATNILGLIITVLIYSFPYNPSLYWQFELIFVIIGLLSIVNFILTIIFLILLGLASHSFSKGRFEFDNSHLKNIKYASLFIIVYLILAISKFIFDLLFLPLTFYSEVTIVLSTLIIYSDMLYIINAFFLGFALLFFVKSFASEFEKDLLFVGVTLLITLPIINTISYMIGTSSSSYAVYMALNFAIKILTFITWSMVLFTYFRIKRSFDQFARFTPKDDKKFLPRPQPMAGYVFRFYSNPIKALKVFMIAAIIISVISGVAHSFRSSNLTEETFSSNPRIEDPYIESKQFVYSDTVAESETMEYTLPLDADVYHLSAYLIWQDEADQARRSNDPDVFSFEMSYLGETLSQTEQNPQGGQGEIYLLKSYEDGAMYIDEISVTITLVYAGDQTGPLGIGSSPLTIEDNSNDYTCVVDLDCTPI